MAVMIPQPTVAGIAVGIAVACLILGAVLMVFFTVGYSHWQDIRHEPKVEPFTESMTRLDHLILARLEAATTSTSVPNRANYYIDQNHIHLQMTVLAATVGRLVSNMKIPEDFIANNPEFLQDLPGDTEKWNEQLSTDGYCKIVTLRALVYRYLYERMDPDSAMDIDQLFLPKPLVQLYHVVQDNPTQESYEIMDKLRPWWRTLTSHFLRAHYRPDKSAILGGNGETNKLYIDFERIETAFWARFDPFVRCCMESSSAPDIVFRESRMLFEEAMVRSVGLALLVFGSHYDLKFEWPEPILHLPERVILLTPNVIYPDGSFYVPGRLGTEIYLTQDGKCLDDKDEKVRRRVAVYLGNQSIEKPRAQRKEAEQRGWNTSIITAETPLPYLTEEV